MVSKVEFSRQLINVLQRGFYVGYITQIIYNNNTYLEFSQNVYNNQNTSINMHKTFQEIYLPW